MIERTENNRALKIQRHVKRNNQLFTVDVVSNIPITSKCVRRYMLMQEDFIQLEFSLTSDELHEIAGVGAISIGDFVDDDIFGRFYVTEEAMPKYNQSTGGYDYSLKLEAEYMLWKNWIHCLTVEVGGTLQRMESEWGLTDRLQVHAQQIADEVNLIEDRHYTVHVNAEKANEIHYIAYNGMNIIEALNILADTWECEWWVVQEEIHFGKMENEASYEFRLGDNVESMDVARDQQTYATRIYAYGGTQNIPEDYDRKLEFTVSSITDEGFLDENKELGIDMIEGDLIAPQAKRFQFDDFPTSTVEPDNNNIATITLESNRQAIRYTNKLQGVIESWLEMDASDWAAVDVPEFSVNVLMKYGAQSGSNYFPNSVPVAASVKRRNHNMWVATIELDDLFHFGDTETETMFVIVWSVAFSKWSVHLDDPVSISNIGAISAFDPNDLKKLVKIVYNGNRYDGIFFNVNKRIQFIDDATSQNVVSAPAGWAEGKVYTLEPLTLKVPISWYTPIYDTGTMSKIGEKRLHLPISDYPGRFLPTDMPADMAQCVEIAVVFDEIFPKLTLRIRPGTVRQEKKKQKIDHSDGSASWEDWTQYSFELQYCTDEENKDSDEAWAPFVFREDYMLDGAKLQAAFIAPTSMQSQGGMLGGMTFDVNFYGINTTTFTIIRNEEYGAKLPNEYIKPSERDELFLTGWNPKAMNSLGLVGLAESELARKGNEYKQAILTGQFTFTCRMMSNWLFDLEADRFFVRHEEEGGDSEPFFTVDENAFYVGNGFTRYRLPLAGDIVTVYHDALKDGSKTSRIIGYEFKLDKPYDTPTYTIGETEAFSRLKQIEKKLTKL